MTDDDATAVHPVYARLGLTRILNAEDTITGHGGSRLPDDVREAMSAASSHQVDLVALMDAVGERIAMLCDIPAALVVAGASAGLVASVAATVAGRERTSPLPMHEIRRRDREVVVLCCQRNPYDEAVEVAGARLRQVGYSDSTPLHALEDALADRPAALLWFAGTTFERHAPAFADVVALARAAGVPVIVDAAAQVPPVSTLWDHYRAGADLVVVSGGKGLKGPQASGLVLGDAAWVAAARRHAFPFHAVGRASKTSKENVVGLLVAVERAIAGALDDSARWDEDLVQAARTLTFDGVSTVFVPSGRLGQALPRLAVAWDPAVRPVTATEVGARLAAGEPSVRVAVGEAGTHGLHLNPYSLEPGECDVVARRLRSVLEESAA